MGRTLVKILMLVALAGCQNQGTFVRSSSSPSNKDDTRYKLLSRGYSVDYVDAYEQGCVSVADENIIKDEERYARQVEYKRGWNQGVATCNNPYGEISREVIEQKKRATSNSDLWKEMKK
ncbi:MAG: hypothetical protein HOI53_00985 [Francisellaceae bacterium]|jgi:hypothetical protein|nr:hypothetical protein [Francisellaceae bacterium]MBT6206575.1 hypothetical protein [Francisellaceae bacterium]MBT6538636.1 hypothetical protein [Francisellaceae bacterium]